MKNRARRVAFAGMFIALNIVLTRFFSYTVVIGGVQNIRLGFGEIPVILSGIMLGPVYGAITGALADLIGYPFNHGSLFSRFYCRPPLPDCCPDDESSVPEKVDLAVPGNNHRHTTVITSDPEYLAA